MNTKQMAMARKQLERRLAPLREMKLVPPPKGWIRAIRDSLGMNDRQLAARMSVAPSRIPALERAEVSGGTTVRTLRQAALALNCTFVYAFVPIEPLDDILRKRAKLKARESMSRLDHTMRLENQAVLPSDLASEEQHTVDRLVSSSLRGLWDEERGEHA
jgi:predicted DNA-binding mobile mystery protein A